MTENPNAGGPDDLLKMFKAISDAIEGSLSKEGGGFGFSAGIPQAAPEFLNMLEQQMRQMLGPGFEQFSTMMGVNPGFAAGFWQAATDKVSDKTKTAKMLWQTLKVTLGEQPPSVYALKEAVEHNVVLEDKTLTVSVITAEGATQLEVTRAEVVAFDLTSCTWEGFALVEEKWVPCTVELS